VFDKADIVQQTRRTRIKPLTPLKLFGLYGLEVRLKDAQDCESLAFRADDVEARPGILPVDLEHARDSENVRRWRDYDARAFRVGNSRRQIR
jgi:hypothetical protein